MYQSREYLEIAGKLITSPYEEGDIMFGVPLHKIVCDLHQCGIQNTLDLELEILKNIQQTLSLHDPSKISLICEKIVNDLLAHGVHLRN